MASNELEVLDPAAKDEKLAGKTLSRAMNRRNLLAGFGIAGAAIGAGLMSRRSVKRPGVVKASSYLSGFTQLDYLNYLLNIKYLQATLYAFITTGNDLPTQYVVKSPLNTPTSPPVNNVSYNSATGAYTFNPIYGGFSPNNVPTVGTKVAFSGANAAQITDLVNEIYYDELNQLIALQNLIGPLGTVALVRPALDLVGTGKLTAAAGSAQAGSTVYTASGTGPVKALGVLRLLEDVAVTAFAGVAQFLSGTNLTQAAQIFAIDGQHSGALRLAIILQNAASVTVTDQLADSAINPGNGNFYPVQADDVAPVDTGASAAATGPIPVPSSTKTVSTTAGPLLLSTQQVLPNASLNAPCTAPIATYTIGSNSYTGCTPPQYEGFFSTTGAATAPVNSPTVPGFAFARTTSQVLSILYGTLGTDGITPPASPALATAVENGVTITLQTPPVTGVIFSGGFFPEGFGGNITNVYGVISYE
jgi:hypothetical protein